MKLSSKRLSTVSIINTVAALSLALGVIVSCKSDDPTTTTTNQSIQGNWRISAININPAVVQNGVSFSEIVSPLNLLENNCIGSTTLTFSNGTVTNNATSISACTSSTNSKLLVNNIFGSSTSYTETDNQLTIRGPQTVTATKTITGSTAMLVTSLSVNPANQPTPTSYTMVLTKQ
ncbi:hypothetical protein [Spirosoma rhododendri]|uniref:Lipocalin-like domain-containing protein n=1 Tax=Spirosoma rhododendri TaxID=2728024 RepID=A0A7L5DHX3_9BACT|nr:hypothetical protein [Spirosoma rhododendri]QJD77615.1 hypothetical protein HH216_03680 [Spirosoma rhododendri]